ncbi:MAG: carboxypeptidase-like regulatory domain-containing protein [Prolixibacteraceae bacterium]|jgi:hypothetical protein|nr:carboxypeptidase-like regulatory domain-containing protein [Prolixibacteraceae bacterium]NLO01168.1 carboxypeptidase-like regulatory domain-containing protein [Bacteroidales bacterium]
MKKHMTKNIILLFSLLLAGILSQAQNPGGVIHTIKGRVLDQATNEPVAFTNISISDTFYGTASDENGNFELKIPGEMTSSQIQFSAVGYKKVDFSATTLINRDYSIIKLEPQSYEIENVDVEARSKVLITILRMASENTPYNFIGGPVNMLAEYVNEKIVDDTVKVEQQAEILIYDKTGYKNPTVLNEFRMRKYEIKKEEPDYRFSSGIMNLDELLGLDWVRSSSSVLNPSLAGSFTLFVEDEPVIEGKSAWVIAFLQADPDIAGSGDFHATSFSGKITILKDDYAVIKIEGRAESPKHNRQGKFLAVGASNSDYLSNVSYDFLVTYKGLKPEQIILNKNYIYGGKKVNENSRLTIKQVQVTEIQEIATRDYFAD